MCHKCDSRVHSELVQSSDSEIRLTALSCKGSEKKKMGHEVVPFHSASLYCCCYYYYFVAVLLQWHRAEHAVLHREDQQGSACDERLGLLM